MRHILLVLVVSLSCYTASATSFNGTSDYEVSTCANASDDTTFTFCAQVNNTASASTASRVAYAEASGLYTDNYAYLGINNALLAECTYRSNSASNSAKGLLLPPGWHTIFCVADGVLLRTYVDGVLQGAWSLTAQPATKDKCTTGALRRGASAIGNYWQGDIAIVQTWDRALTPEEVSLGCVSSPNCTADTVHFTPTPTLIWSAATSVTRIDGYEVYYRLGPTDDWHVGATLPCQFIDDDEDPTTFERTYCPGVYNGWPVQRIADWEQQYIEFAVKAYDSSGIRSSNYSNVVGICMPAIWQFGETYN